MITCFFENNNKAFLRHVVVDGICIKNNQILLVKRAPHLTNPNKYALPGGYLDRDETTIDAVKREVLEETGYKTLETKLFRINDNPNRGKENRQSVDFIFIIKVGEKIGKSDSEVTQVKWFGLDKLPDKKDFAFDHLDNILLFKKYQKQKFSLPIFTP